MKLGELQEVVRTQVTLAAGGAGPLVGAAVSRIMEAAQKYAEPDLFTSKRAGPLEGYLRPFTRDEVAVLRRYIGEIRADLTTPARRP